MIQNPSVVVHKDEEEARKSVGGVHVADPMLEPMMTRVGGSRV